MKKNLLFLLGLSLLIGSLFYSSHPAQAAFGDTASYLGKIYAGDGETALNAYLDMPQGFVMDAAGNIYIADNFNNVIRKIDTSNIVSTYSGTGEYGKADGARTSATWSWPEGITMDPDGIIYVADTGSNKIRKIQGDTVTTLSITGLKGPRAVIVSGTTLYISDTRNNRIVQVSTSGGTPTELATGLSSPSKIVLVGNILYVADFGSGSIIAVDVTTGTKTTIASGLTEPRAVAYYNGYLYVAAGENGVWNEIWRIYLTDNSIVQLVKTRETTMLNAAADMFIREINSTPKIYQLHGGGSAIFTFDIDAQNSQQIAGKNRYGDEPGTRSVALLGRPKDLVFSPDGTKLYIVYAQGNKIAEYNIATDQVTALAGFLRDSYVEGIGDAVRFSDVTSIAISNDGKTLYVIDRNNNRLRSLNIATKETHYLTGAGEINSNALTNNGYQEGGPCDNQLNKGVAGCAYFNRPTGIVITKDGKTIYLADVGNNRVRKVTVATGQTSLVAGSGTAGFKNGTGSSASFNGPAALTLSSDEKNLYVIDKNNQVIRQIELATGKVTTLAGVGKAGYKEGKFNKAVFNAPEYIKLGDDGNLYISEAGTLKIRKLDLAKQETSLVSGSGERGAVNGAGAKAEWNGPKGFAFLSGVMYAADFYNDQIRTVLITGKVVSKPSITKVAPSVISLVNLKKGATTKITITGKNFAKGATVKVNNVKATKVTVKNANVIQATIPLAGLKPGLASVTVTNADKGTVTLAKAITLKGKKPTLTSAAPKTLPAKKAGVGFITLKGTNFLVGARVFLDGKTAVVKTQVLSSSRIKITVNLSLIKKNKTYNLMLINPDNQKATLGKAFKGK